MLKPPWITLMLSCPTHGHRLETEQAFWRAEALGQPAPDRAAPEHILVTDRLTFQGLTSGTVSLPRRSVHVGVWLRLLRTSAGRGRPVHLASPPALGYRPGSAKIRSDPP
ncbi:hypothetical protein GCM10010176_104480 [Nonomuraea spiralis]|nr:hypothetical protein GCM10010176_104480 [Nonomuraea spiralis]